MDCSFLYQDVHVFACMIVVSPAHPHKQQGLHYLDDTHVDTVLLALPNNNNNIIVTSLKKQLLHPCCAMLNPLSSILVDGIESTMSLSLPAIFTTIQDTVDKMETLTVV